MTRLLLIYAGPTPWDLEDRLVGNNPLPLTEEARASIEAIARGMNYPASIIYRYPRNEAADQAARVIAKSFQISPRESKALDELNLGLWQGLTRDELAYRYETVFPHWMENPLSINPPEGEPLGDAIERIRGGVRNILKRNRGITIVLPLRPFALQIVLGILRHETPEMIAKHLHYPSSVETIDLDNEALQKIVSK